jgi:catechol 2,3-dioxygenase-like lactoylglutathione lyase family enzyme
LVGHDGVLNGVHVRLGKYQDFNLVRAREVIHGPGSGVKIYLLKDIPDIDAYAGELKAKGVNIIEGPVDRPWNLREIIISDPDGYRFVFSQVINTQMKFEEVVRQMKEKVL